MSQNKTEDQYNAIDWFMKCLKNYANFQGRARRKEYWFFVLVYIGLSIVAGIIDGVLGTYYVVSGILMLAMIIPSLSVAVRRLHDTGRTGWWYLIAFVPFGAFVLIYWFASDTKPETNQWGGPTK